MNDEDHAARGRDLLMNHGGAQHNAIAFAVRQALGETRTHVLVKVLKVHGGGVGPAPTIDCTILTNQVDGLGKSTAHGTIYGVQTKRNQGSSFAIINDPQPGDIGELAIHDRDMSSVVRSQQQANPASNRRFNLSNSTYYGKVGDQTTPTQYVNFRKDGVDIVDNQKNKITTGSAGINLNGVIIDVDGNIKAPGDITAGQGGGDQISLQNHVHSGVQPGAGDTAQPVAGT